MRGRRRVAQCIGQRRLAGFVALTAMLLGRPHPASAEVAVRSLAQALTAEQVFVGPDTPFLRRSTLSAIVEVPAGEDPASAGLGRIGSRFSVVKGPLATLNALSAAHPDWGVTWSAPLRPLLDKATTWAGAPTFRNETGLTGKGTYVAIVDTGADVLHPDLRNADGTTRIAYLIDFSATPSENGDTEAQNAAKLPCSVYTGAYIDSLIQSGQADAILSHDMVGHGTHVTSLAAGNGGAAHRFVGMAPEASLIIARVVDGTDDIGDAAVLAATDLIFWLADRGVSAGKPRVPTVVNMSLGSDFGPHDGTAPLERALSEFVGPDQPGRSIVVAAGNSAGLVAGAPGVPNPLGIRTEVNVPQHSTVQIPILQRTVSSNDEIDATLFIWLSFRPSDDLKVGVDRNGAEWAPPQSVGSAVTIDPTEPANVTIVNGPLSALSGFSLSIAEPDDQNLKDANSAAIIIDGKWPKTDQFSIRLEGHGTASLWLQPQGDLAPGGPGLALFPAASKESTITLPATHPSLISVGASLNRLNWTDAAGDAITVQGFGADVNPPLDSIAFFSSAGPTTDLRIKPDLVAPGAFVIGAMSRDANPATNDNSIFADAQFCDPAATCNVVDDNHAVTLGTSMSSPIVAGAVALLFQGDPTLTQDRILTLLQAGARFPRGDVPLASQLGAGALNLPGALDVERALVTPVHREPAASTSWLSMGGSFAHPDPTWTIPALLELRDVNGLAADGFDMKTLTVNVDQGIVTRPIARVAPGLFSFAVAANRGTGGDTLGVDVRYKGESLVVASGPIAVDVNVALEGFSAHGGACNVAHGGRRGYGVWAFAGALIVARGRRSKRAARTARNRDRTGS